MILNSLQLTWTVITGYFCANYLNSYYRNNFEEVTDLEHKDIGCLAMGALAIALYYTLDNLVGVTTFNLYTCIAAVSASLITIPGQFYCDLKYKRLQKKKRLDATSNNKTTINEKVLKPGDKAIHSELDSSESDCTSFFHE